MADEQLEANQGNRVYAPPAEDAERPQAALPALGRHASYRSQRVLVWVLTVLLVLLAALWGTHGAAELAAASAGPDLQRAVHKPPGYNDGPAGIVYLLIQLGLAVYLFTANKNAHAFAATDAEKGSDEEAGDQPLTDEPVSSVDDQEPLDRAQKPKRAVSIERFTPASMLWWYLVPVFGFFRPYQAMKAVWGQSARAANASAQPGDEAVWQWWAAWLTWLAMVIFNQRVLRLELEPWQRFGFVSLKTAVGLGLCGFTLRLVHALAARQCRRAAELWS